MTPDEWAVTVALDFPATPYFDQAWKEKVAAVIGKAIAAERERCAKVAETYAEDIADADQRVFAELAKQIREGKGR